jgi:hypothetical protein
MNSLEPLFLFHEFCGKREFSSQYPSLKAV